MDAPETTSRGRGRPPGSKNKPRPEPLSDAKLREIAKNCYTPKQWEERFRRLPINEQFRLRVAMEPKQREAAEPAPRFKLVIEGLEPKLLSCPKCGHLDDIKRFCNSDDSPAQTGQPEG